MNTPPYNKETNTLTLMVEFRITREQAAVAIESWLDEVPDRDHPDKGWGILQTVRAIRRYLAANGAPIESDWDPDWGLELFDRHFPQTNKKGAKKP